MAQRSIQGGEELAKRIRQRRNELNLTIEEAALRAGVGTKTWSRYEAGESIRMDKYKGVCKALNWRDFSEGESGTIKKSFCEEFKDHEAWSQFLAENYGDTAAAAFAAGSDVLLDDIEQDMSELASMPAGSHMGQLDVSFLCDELPPQFLMRYDYDFLYRMRCTLLDMRTWAGSGASMVAHSVMEELIFYLCNEEAKVLVDLSEEGDLNELNDWVFDLFDDMDIIMCLYSDKYLDEDHLYHFDRWNDRQFYTDR